MHGVCENLPSVTENLHGVTDTPNKELLINNYIEKNNILHVFPENTDMFLNLLDFYSLNRFGKQIRKHNGEYDIEMLIGVSSVEEILEGLDELIDNYDQCNLDYLQTVQFRLM